MDSEQPDYEQAPCLGIPAKHFFAVEYPGYVKNLENVLKTLGGQRGLNKAVNQDLVELRFRPDDPFCHPINGDIIPTANLLTKVTRWRKKSKYNGNNFENNIDDKDQDNNDDNNSHIEFKILGIISRTCRFRGMADFQHIVHPNSPIRNFRQSLEKFDVEGLGNLEYKIENEEGDPPPNLPPPSFSRTECPMDYGYDQNAAVIKVLIQKDETHIPTIRLINRSRRRKFVALSITFDTRIVPDGPPQEAKKHIHKTPLESRDKMQKLFKKRPVWTRLALESSLGLEDKKIIKRLLPLYAYWMVNGPWRDCWTRYGFDPRKDRDARFYQLLDIRNNKRPVRTDRAKRVLRRQSDYVVDDMADIITSDPQIGHIFDGKTRCRDVAVFQMCDIEDELLKSLINSTDGLSDKCQRQYGFFKKSQIVKMRKVMRRKVDALHEGVILSDNAFDDLLQSDNDSIVDEDEDEDNDIGMLLEEELPGIY
ncbi:hypothetical protein G9A89_001200 [Geosiphon pyriformis]|nr:hypothetical protein G9A89_001200 [Geosiphon pyriformis]